MTESIVNKNYLLGTKLSFLIMSFLIVVIAVTVRNDIWPFLQMTNTAQGNTQWLLVSYFLSFVLAGAWLAVDWKKTAIRYGLIALLLMIFLQWISEYLVSYYFFSSMTIPTSILYVSYRLIQLGNLQKLIYKTQTKKDRLWRTGIVAINFVIWLTVWIQIVFYIFPQIICQIS